MRVYVHDGTDPGVNLALEQAVLGDPAGREDCCWLWTNAPSVILGRNQVLEAEVDVPYARAHGIPVYRRDTGGGAVYHDGGVVNFSFVVPARRPVADCLGPFLEALGLPAVATERNDVLWRGRKIVGTAQRLQGARRLFHGSLLYAADLERLSRVLTPAVEKLRRHGVASVRARVANCGPVGGLSADMFRRALTERLAARFGGMVEPMPEPLLDAARRRRLQPLSMEEV